MKTKLLDVAITFWLIGQVVGRVQGYFQMDTGATFVTSAAVLALCLFVLSKTEQSSRKSSVTEK